VIKICANSDCGKEFNANLFHPKQIYCCKKCRDKQWEKNNLDRRLEWHKLWDTNNPGRKSGTNKIWHRNNKGRLSKISRLWYQCNKEKKVAVARVWRENNPEAVKNARIRRRSSKHGVSGDHYTASQFQDLRIQTGNICLCCGEKKKLTADHVIPLSRGGSDAIDNIQPLCLSCNDRKALQTVDYRSQQWQFQR
jgi:5-methylcytosine-specific restriction endonuclease McrA